MTIVKALLPRIAQLEKLLDYLTKAKCVKWLKELAGRTTWDTEMEQMTSEKLDKKRRAPRLF